MIKVVQLIIIVILSLLIVGQEFDGVGNNKTFQIDQTNVSNDDDSNDIDLDNVITSKIQLFSLQILSPVIIENQQKTTKLSFVIFSIRAPPKLNYS